MTAQSIMASVVVGYDASTAAAVPSAPDWSVAYGTDMTLSGGLLHQNTAAGGDASAYRAKETPGLMVRSTTDYTVQFKAQVLQDTPAGDWYTNTFVVWGDNTQSYSVSLYRNGATGGLKTGSGTTIGNLTDVVAGVDWSSSHLFDITYAAATDNFKVYVDGALGATVPANGLVQGGVEPFWRDRVVFGDYLAGGSANSATQTDWSLVALHNSAVPEPASLAMLGLAGLATLRRRH